MRLLAAASSPLNNPSLQIKDNDGNTIGYKVSEEKFNEIMSSIKKYAIIDYEKRTGRKYVSGNEEQITSSYLDTALSPNNAYSSYANSLTTNP